MANIVITDVCNLRCPYCFANEFVNQDANEISMENYRTAKNFILTKDSGLGLIGGEPLLHSHFREILQDLIYDDRVQKVTIFTNGIHCNEYIDEFSNEKFRFLINCNPPSDTGRHNFDRMVENLELMIRGRYMKKRISLGINMYRPDFEYDYLVSLLEKYHFDHVRVSITVPNTEQTEENHGEEVFRYFNEIKPRMMEFFNLLLSKGIRPHYDCNKLPSCLLRDEDYALLKENLTAVLHGGKPHPNDAEVVRCHPVVDILQDLTAIRCFGLSRYTRTDIRNFGNLEELREYYKRTIDAYACNTAYHKDCISCNKRLNSKCYGGCLAYKIGDIVRMQEYSRKLMESGSKQ